MSDPYKQHFNKLKNQNVISAENKQRQILLNSIKNKTSAKKTKRKFPMGACLLAIGFLSLSIYAGLNSDNILATLDKVEIELSNMALAEESTNPALSKQNNLKKENVTENSANQSAEKAKTISEDQLSIFSGLEKRKLELDSKEAELQKLSEELLAQKKELEEKILHLEQIRNKIAEKLEVQVVKDEEKVDALVAVYAGMKAQNAASVMEAIDEDLAVKVLLKMKKNEAASILNLVKPEKAKRLSERFVGMLSK